MKRITVFMMMCLFTLTIFACNPVENKTNDQEKNIISTKKIDVYYFHFSRRCATCNAVEDVTKEAINENFSEKVKSGEIIFKSINLDEDAGKKIAEKFDVSGQTLLFVSDGKKINLTNDGFMYARSNPEKLKALVKVTVNKLME